MLQLVICCMTFWETRCVWEKNGHCAACHCSGLECCVSDMKPRWMRPVGRWKNCDIFTPTCNFVHAVTATCIVIQKSVHATIFGKEPNSDLHDSTLSLHLNWTRKTVWNQMFHMAIIFLYGKHIFWQNEKKFVVPYLPCARHCTKEELDTSMPGKLAMISPMC